MKKGNSRTGFTMIEVILVFAIAGLIFAMVFIALPSLQRSQRDSKRQEDLMKFISEVKRYQTNNRGNLPGVKDTAYPVSVSASSTGGKGTWAEFYGEYLGKNFIDPDGENYQLTVIKCGASSDVVCSDGLLSNMTNSGFPYSGSFASGYTIMVVLQAKCDGNQAVGSSSQRNLAALYRLETGVYCDAT